MNHTSVLLQESIDALNIKPGGVYIDGTFGRGGHSKEILKHLTTGRLIAFDQDHEAYTQGLTLANSEKNFHIIIKVELFHLNSFIKVKN